MGFGKLLGCVVGGAVAVMAAPAIGAISLAAGVAGVAAGGALMGGATTAFGESFVDHTIRDKVSNLKSGAVVYCDLFTAEHSGIYIGNKKIVHLNGDGKIEIVSPKQFLERWGGFNPVMSIYVSCNGTNSVGSYEVAKRAEAQVGKKRNYHLAFDNCHQFTAGCLTGDFEDPNNFLWMLKDEARNALGADTWRVWDL